VLLSLDFKEKVKRSHKLLAASCKPEYLPITDAVLDEQKILTSFRGKLNK
jgi:hypothetical protein